MVEVTIRWRGNIQAKGQWGLVGIDLRAHLGPLRQWSKSTGENAIAEIGMRLRMTRIQHHPEEKELFHTY